MDLAPKPPFTAIPPLPPAAKPAAPALRWPVHVGTVSTMSSLSGQGNGHPYQQDGSVESLLVKTMEIHNDEHLKMVLTRTIMVLISTIIVLWRSYERL